MSGRAGPWQLGRREFLGTMAVALAKLGAGGCGGGGHGLELERDPPPPAPSIPDGVFQLGVASGDPLDDRVVLWTRLAPEPLEGGGMPDVDVPVIWEVFTDEDLTNPVRNGWTWARPALAHSVHVDVDGLSPERFYWYRFRIGDDQVSAVGRTRTFPRPNARPDRMRVALACCQKYRDGFYTAHDHLAAMSLDAVLFVGDYIYESGGDTDVPGRLPIDTVRVTDLPGFRQRYGAYRMDPSLQAAHAAHPWIVTWDDHEVSNDYAGFSLDEDRQDDGDIAEMRAAGYQVWYEHMPVRVAFPDDPTFMTIYRKFHYGDLASLFILDGRQYRDPPPCDTKIAPPCDEMLAGGRTKLGPEQMDWLLRSVRESNGLWNVITQNVLFSPVLFEIGLANRDQWDGYIDDRQTILDLMAEPSVRNPMVLSGDVHAAGFGELYRDQFDPTSERVALEVLTTSISSGGDDAEGLGEAASLAESLSQSVHYIDAGRRGFAVCDYTRDGCEVTYHAVTTVRSPQADLFTAARFQVEVDTLDFTLLERT
jgi:alkaline phosphatase D